MRKLTVLIALVVAGAACASAQDVHVKVDPKGGGGITSTDNFATIQQALDHSPEAPHGRIYIEIAPGTYNERINVTRLRPRLTLIGLGKRPDDVVINASQNAKSAGGTYFSETAQVNADDFEADNVTFQNSAGATGQAVAIVVRSDRAVFKHCRFIGDQDTLFADFGRQYYVDSYIEGGVDFIFGNATAVFERDEIHEIRSGYLTAQSRTAETQTTGYVIDHSKVTDAATMSADGKAPSLFLGRPWRVYSRVVVMNTELPEQLNAAGWSAWGRTDPTPKAYYAEFNNSGPGWKPKERVAWSHQLTAAQAIAFGAKRFLAGTDDWDAVAVAAKMP
jgi:pectinesterase